MPTLCKFSMAHLLDNPKFELEPEDEPFVSGHSVSEHLQYCIDKYCPDKTVEEARRHYFEIVTYEKRRHRVIGIEDSGAGVVALRLAGFEALGIAGGNIAGSGTLPLLGAQRECLMDALPFILGQ